MKKEFGVWHVQVYCDYWIVNKTGDDLVYVRRETNDYDMIVSMITMIILILILILILIP